MRVLHFVWLLIYLSFILAMFYRFDVWLSLSRVKFIPQHFIFCSVLSRFVFLNFKHFRHDYGWFLLSMILCLKNCRIDLIALTVYVFACVSTKSLFFSVVCVITIEFSLKTQAGKKMLMYLCRLMLGLGPRLWVASTET